MAFLHFERGFVPCGFLIVRDGVDPHRELPGDSVLIDDSRDILSIAQDLGFDVEDADGADVYDWLYARNGRSFPQLDEYLRI